MQAWRARVRWGRPRQLIAFVTVTFVFSFAAWFAVPPDHARIDAAGRGLVILSVEGNELRRFRETDSGSHTRHQGGLDAYPPALIKAVLLAEDRRFYLHPGLDPLAILRATFQNIAGGRIISGGSTITQQLIRLIYARELPKSAWLRKPAEWLLALRWEIHTTKTEILSAYLNRVPLPGNRTGIIAGAEYLFGRDPRFLNHDESLALAVLIRRNHTNQAAFRARFRRLAAKIAGDQNAILEPPADLLQKIFERRDLRKTIRREVTHRESTKSPGHSPHFTDWMRNQFPDITGVIRTQLSENRNETIHRILAGELTALRKLNARHAAIVVLRIELLTRRLVLEGLVGSRDYDDPRGGQINGATTRRVAGSTLKPFLYGLAMEEQDLRPYSIVYDNDANVSLGAGATYRPRNYDLNYWGAMTAREALATSRNIPAVKIAEELGEERVFVFLRQAGFFPTTNQSTGEDTTNTGSAQPYAYGPGIALGISGATLLDLTRAYAAFATGGRQYPIFLGESENGRKLLYGTSDRLFSERTAYLITHILSDRSMRRRAFGDRSFLDFPFEVAAKTGTSKDYRDAWTVGYTGQYVVGVWVGNFDATPMKSVSGAYGAGRIFHQVVRSLHRDQKRRFRFQYPEEWKNVSICRHTGLVATERCESYSELIPPEDVTPAQCHGEHTGAHPQANLNTDPNHDGPGTSHNSNLAASDGNGRDSIARRYLLSPTPGAVYYLDPHAPRTIQEIPLRLHGSFLENSDGIRINFPVTNGERRTCRPIDCPATLALNPGDYRIRVTRSGETVEELEFQVK